MAIFRTESWYDCVYGERGFRDIPDWQNIVLPEIQNKKAELLESGLSPEETDKKIDGYWKRFYIEQIRLKKKPQRANVVEALFPETPFKSDSFDRFVASWSISAHAFSEFNEKDFMICWREIRRLLKPEGDAYIFPLNYSPLNEQAFFDSLDEISSIGIEWELYDKEGNPIDYLGDAITLYMHKINYNND